MKIKETIKQIFCIHNYKLFFKPKAQRPNIFVCKKCDIRYITFLNVPREGIAWSLANSWWSKFTDKDERNN